MKKITTISTLIFLSACTSVAPEKVPFNGKEALKINTVVMGDVTPATEEQKAAALVEAREGSKGSRLPPQANKACPNGYTILQAGEQVEKPYLIAAAGEFNSRFTQSFLIECK